MTDKEILEWAKETYRAYARQVANLTGLRTPEMPRFTIGDVEGGAAGMTDSARGVITLDRNWIKDHPQDEGLIVHEMVHLFHNAPPGSKNSQIEGLADAIRGNLGLDDYDWQEADNKWADMKPWQIQLASKALAGGQLTPELVNKIRTGEITREAYQAATTQAAAANVAGAVTGVAGTIGDVVTNLLGITQEGDGEGGGGGGGIDLGTYKPEDETSDAAAEARRIQNARASFLTQLSGLGVSITPNLNELVKQASQKGWNLDRFMYYVRQTPDYRRSFPGILNEDGSLKMSEAQYLAAQDQYESYASRYGINMSPARMAWLFKNDVLPSEFADRAPAVNRLNRDKELYQQFGRELVQAGIAKPSEIDSRKELLKFVMGEGKQEWYDLWQDAVTRNAAVQAGLAINKKLRYTGIGQKWIEKLSGRGLSEEAMASGFAQVADDLLAVLPMSEAARFGLNKGDIIEATFGGRGSAKARAKLKRVIETNEAFSMDRANPAVYTDETGGAKVLGSGDTSKRRQAGLSV